MVGIIPYKIHFICVNFKIKECLQNSAIEEINYNLPQIVTYKTSILFYTNFGFFLNIQIIVVSAI